MVVITAQARDIAPAWQVLCWKSLEKRRLRAATVQHEDVILVGLQVHGSPWFYHKIISMAFRRPVKGVAVRHGQFMERYSVIRIVYVENPVRTRRNMHHQNDIHTEEKFAKSCMATARLEGKQVVNCQIATV
jgi:hypothetical protein